MTDALKSIVASRRGMFARLACLPAILFFGFLALVPADQRMAVEASLLVVCLVQTAWPTLLGWAVVLSWFALSAAETIELSLRPGYYGSQASVPLGLVILPLLCLIALRPRVQAAERFAPVFAVLIGLVGVLPLFTVWSP